MDLWWMLSCHDRYHLMNGDTTYPTLAARVTVKKYWRFLLGCSQSTSISRMKRGVISTPTHHLRCYWQVTIAITVKTQDTHTSYVLQEGMSNGKSTGSVRACTSVISYMPSLLPQCNREWDIMTMWMNWCHRARQGSHVEYSWCQEWKEESIIRRDDGTGSYNICQWYKATVMQYVMLTQSARKGSMTDLHWFRKVNCRGNSTRSSLYATPNLSRNDRKCSIGWSMSTNMAKRFLKWSDVIA